MTFKIVLYQPEIPENTGNIGRLCVGTNSELHIIKPMKFFMSDKHLKRAGLDYWTKVKIFLYDSFDDYLLNNNINIYFFSTKGKKIYSNINFKSHDSLVFGAETKGLPELILNKYAEKVFTIPMTTEIRSLNLANSVAIVLYEALKQNNYNFYEQSN